MRSRSASRSTLAQRLLFDLDDDVMINSAALGPLLDSWWKDPRNRWPELSRAEDKKGCSVHLAVRYWPSRVAAKCATDRDAPASGPSDPPTVFD